MVRRQLWKRRLVESHSDIHLGKGGVELESSLHGLSIFFVVFKQIRSVLRCRVWLFVLVVVNLGLKWDVSWGHELKRD